MNGAEYLKSIDEKLEYLKKNYIGKYIAYGNYSNALKRIESVEYIRERDEFCFYVLEMQYDSYSLNESKYVINKAGVPSHFDGNTYTCDMGYGLPYETEIPDFRIVTDKDAIKTFTDILEKQKYLTSKNGAVVTKNKTAAFNNEFGDLTYGIVEDFNDEQKCLIIRVGDTTELRANVINTIEGNCRYYKKSCDVVIV